MTNPIAGVRVVVDTRDGVRSLQQLQQAAAATSRTMVTTTQSAASYSATVNQVLTQTATAASRAGQSVASTAPAWNKLGSALSGVALAAGGIPGPVGRVANALGGLALGGAGAAGLAVAGLGALVAAFVAFDAPVRAAREELKRFREEGLEAFKDFQSRSISVAADKVKEATDQLVRGNQTVARIRSELGVAQQTAPGLVETYQKELKKAIEDRTKAADALFGRSVTLLDLEKQAADERKRAEEEAAAAAKRAQAEAKALADRLQKIKTEAIAIRDAFAKGLNLTPTVVAPPDVVSQQLIARQGSGGLTLQAAASLDNLNGELENFRILTGQAAEANQRAAEAAEEARRALERETEARRRAIQAIGDSIQALLGVAEQSGAIGSKTAKLLSGAASVGVGIATGNVAGIISGGASLLGGLFGDGGREKRNQARQARQSQIDSIDSFLDSVRPRGTELEELTRTYRQLYDEGKRLGLANHELARLTKGYTEQLARLTELELQRNLAAQDDLRVRELIAQGRDTEAEALQRQLAAQRELDQAMKDGFNSVTIETLKRIQALEAEAAATRQAAAEAERLAQETRKRADIAAGLGIRELTARGALGQDVAAELRAAQNAAELEAKRREGYTAAELERVQYLQGLEAEAEALAATQAAAERAAREAQEAAEAMRRAEEELARERERQIELLRQETRAQEDLNARKLRAQGLDAAADELALLARQRQEVEDARGKGFSAALIADLIATQKLERDAFASTRAARQQADFDQAAGRNFGLTTPTFGESSGRVDLAVGVSESTVNRLAGLAVSQLAVQQEYLPNLATIVAELRAVKTLLARQSGLSPDQLDQILGAVVLRSGQAQGLAPTN